MIGIIVWLSFLFVILCYVGVQSEIAVRKRKVIDKELEIKESEF